MWKALCIYEQVDVPYDRVCDLLAGIHEHVLDVDEADGPDATRLGATLAGLEVSRPVRLVRGSLHREARLARIPLRLKAADHAGFFPCLEAVLEVTALDDGRRPLTQLCLVGRYRPPLSLLGAAGDALGGQGIAEESLRRFLAQVAARVQSQCAPAPDAAPVAPRV